MTDNSLNIQIRRIESDLAELLFNPREVDLRVGETLTLRERETGRGVIVQIIAFRSASYPALAKEQMSILVEGCQCSRGSAEASSGAGRGKRTKWKWLCR
ncbi:MAG: hypothetical protein QM730_21015 [Anaerolineales bacterium]